MTYDASSVQMGTHAHTHSLLTLKNPLIPVSPPSHPPKQLGGGKWLELQEISFQEPFGGKEQRWEICRRRKSANWSDSLPDGVDIHAIIHAPDSSPLLLLVVQYRPAIGAYCLEFPSGLVDGGETPTEAASRELAEETGYVAKPFHITPKIAYEPGMTDSCCCVAYVEIDASKEENSSPNPHPEAEEVGLQSVCVPLEGLWESLNEIEQQYEGKLVVDSRLQAFADGMRIWEKWGPSQRKR